VLSHYHGDHFDDVAARDLDRAIPILTTDHAVGQLRELGFAQGLALDTWDSVTVEKGEARLVVTAMPAKHSTDDEVALMLMPVNGSMLDFYRGEDRLFRLYITGDTMLHDRLHDIPRWYPDIDLGLIHAGGTTLFVTVVTMTGPRLCGPWRSPNPGRPSPSTTTTSRYSCPASTTSSRPPPSRPRRPNSTISPMARPTTSSRSANGVVAPQPNRRSPAHPSPTV
jgi:hypothetical protein